jgi:hypothetical protein
VIAFTRKALNASTICGEPWSARRDVLGASAALAGPISSAVAAISMLTLHVGTERDITDSWSRPTERSDCAPTDLKQADALAKRIGFGGDAT